MVIIPQTIIYSFIYLFSTLDYHLYLFMPRQRKSGAYTSLAVMLPYRDTQFGLINVQRNNDMSCNYYPENFIALSLLLPMKYALFIYFFIFLSYNKCVPAKIYINYVGFSIAHHS